MLTRDERELLENTIDALDRLFDSQSEVVDLYALLFATGKAFGSNPLHGVFDPPVHELRKLIQSKESEDQRRDFALIRTNDLRKAIADELRRDAVENPKQRHYLSPRTNNQGPTTGS